jgi:hypothetical protein
MLIEPIMAEARIRREKDDEEIRGLSRATTTSTSSLTAKPSQLNKVAPSHSQERPIGTHKESQKPLKRPIEGTKKRDALKAETELKRKTSDNPEVTEGPPTKQKNLRKRRLGENRSTT